MIVKATREGLIGDVTSSGYRIDAVVAFVALPSVRALQRFVRVTNPATGRSTLAQVLDVGPHFTHDDAYVFGTARPGAETGRKGDGTPMNGAGIDLSEAVWDALGMTDNGPVDWTFV
ncbi:MAG TPA: hypothetical protein VGQ44_01410 [Gemmatimonadaceae bacterium]|jgi:rare lipoprotein A (peptidoglycan hydrolase)|nr:hypothetical protein [Gemmatimonadaceae bacterium]